MFKKLVLAVVLCGALGVVNVFAESCEAAQEECNSERQTCSDKQQTCRDVSATRDSFGRQCLDTKNEKACYEAEQYSRAVDYACGLVIDICDRAARACTRADKICGRRGL
jgi:hypothetical protein